MALRGVSYSPRGAKTRESYCPLAMLSLLSPSVVVVLLTGLTLTCLGASEAKGKYPYSEGLIAEIESFHVCDPTILAFQFPPYICFPCCITRYSSCFPRLLMEKNKLYLSTSSNLYIEIPGIVYYNAIDSSKWQELLAKMLFLMSGSGVCRFTILHL